MFSQRQKKEIAEAVERVILSFDHPEMPKERPVFHLHVKGKESWSWADIEPNWTFEDKSPGVNPFNEMQDKPIPPKTCCREAEKLIGFMGKALELARFHTAACAESSHFMDGLKGRKLNANDFDLEAVNEAIAGYKKFLADRAGQGEGV
jgi:hypothetical protein